MVVDGEKEHVVELRVTKNWRRSKILCVIFAGPECHLFYILVLVLLSGNA